MDYTNCHGCRYESNGYCTNWIGCVEANASAPSDAGYTDTLGSCFAASIALLAAFFAALYFGCYAAVFLSSVIR